LRKKAALTDTTQAIEAITTADWMNGKRKLECALMTRQSIQDYTRNQ